MRVFLIILFINISACSMLKLTEPKQPILSESAKEPEAPKNSTSFCSSQWFQYVETQVSTGDQHGHGPDLGSEEWQSVIESKLGLVETGASASTLEKIPSRNSPQWCEFIQKYLDDTRQIPSFSCQDTGLNSTEKLICKTAVLADLDDELNTVFLQALKKSNDGDKLKAEQRAWLKSRSQCRQDEKVARCFQEIYQTRIAELQARYQLLDGLGPVFYVCDGRPSDEFIVTFYATTPPSLIAERAEQVSFMSLKKSAGGSRYIGPNEQFWEYENQANIIWGNDEPQMLCEKMH